MNYPHPIPVTLQPLGDSAVRISCGKSDEPPSAAQVASLAATLAAEQCLGVTDIVPAYAIIVVHYDLPTIHAAGVPSAYQFVAEWIENCAARNIETSLVRPQAHLIPVRYGSDYGTDLESVAQQNKLATDEVIRRHSQATYTVRAVGFTPGFPYLEGLPAELSTPRRATPRTEVPAGSVGIGGNQTGIYPLTSPGGWNLIGRTPVRLFDPHADPASLLRAGDTVRFQAIDRAEFDSMQLSLQNDPVTPQKKKSRVTVFDVIQPGMQTSIQDLGRFGHQSEGVTPGGAMDLLAARVANLLVGNPDREPLLEAVMRGPKLRMASDALIAITGASVPGIAGWRPLHVTKGEILDCSPIVSGARIYIAVAGGIHADRVLDGYGTDLNSHFGGYQGRPLGAGDRLYLSASPSQPTASEQDSPRWFASPQSFSSQLPNNQFRVLRGPQADWFSEAAWQQLLGESYTVSPQSNRMGIRLKCQPLDVPLCDMTSEPVVFGAVQIPPDGQPIILAADRQTIGGYPVIACIVSADRSRLAQLCPGEQIQFVEVSHYDAEQSIVQCEQNFAKLKLALRELG